jgi:hypothetical protein
VTDVIKGEHDGATLELKFLGGSINGRILEVSGLRLPALNETGIYFIETLSQDLVNPLMGWSQGHFLIQSDANGLARVTTNDNAPVLEVQPLADVPQLLRRPAELIGGTNDAARGVVTDSSALRMPQALTVDEFKSRIRELSGNPLP